MQFGKSQIEARKLMAVKLGIPEKNNEYVDYIIGISQNKPSIVGPTMKMKDIDDEHQDLVASLLHLYNGNDSKIPEATQFIEWYIDEIEKRNEGNIIPIPHGLLSAIYGSVREFNEVMTLGIERGLKSKCNSYGSKIPENMTRAVPLLMVYIGQPDSFRNYMKEEE